MIKWKVRRVDDGKNSDMVHIYDHRGMIQALVHVDAFWVNNNNTGEIYELLRSGQEVEVGVILQSKFKL